MIPDLDLGMQATEIVAPVTTWGAIARSRPMSGTYCFYTYDKNFTALWKDPMPLVQSGCKAAVELNYTTLNEDDPEDVLVGIYRKRLIARLWQGLGIRILVDLDVAPQHLDLALLGVPRGWRAYATRSHRLSQMDTVEDEYDVAVAHAGTSDILFAVFGGSKKVAARCKERGYIHIPENVEVATGRAEPFGGVRSESKVE